VDRPLGVAGKAIIRKDGRILLLRRSEASSHDPGLWELPGGKIDYGEVLVEGLKREVAEETGLDVAVGRPFTTWHFYKDPFWVTGVTFVCENVDREVALSDEHSEYVWIDAREHAGYSLGTTMEEQIEAYLELLAGK
jgi:8-oxo-dGTP diphosphatase